MAPDPQDLLKTINQRMKRLGDLPIFSASVSRIRKVSADPESTALALTREIEQDANLTAKILTLANSSYYNSGKGKISTVSRAVILLGFDTIGNICLTLKLIDGFQRENTSIDMNRLMVNAYLSAVFVREVALRGGIKDIEEVYTCALLHNLGEAAIAYFLPEKYLQVLQVHQAGEQDRPQIEKEVLGLAFREVGKHLAISWELPSNIVKTMEYFDIDTPPDRLKGVMLNRALASLGNAIVGTLHGGQRGSQHNLGALIGKMADMGGLDHALVQHDLVESFMMSCELAKNYGMKTGIMVPDVSESGDEFRDRLAGRLSYLAVNYQSRGSFDNEAAESNDRGDAIDAAGTDAGATGAVPEAGASVSGPATSSLTSPTPEKTLDAGLQLEFVQAITMMMTRGAKSNDVLIKVLDGMNEGAEFERVALLLISPDRASYFVRLSAGEDTQKLRNYFNRPLRPERDLFSKIILDGDELYVDDCAAAAWRSLLSEDFPELTGARAFLVGALRNESRPIGLFYADNAITQTPVSELQRRGFRQFLSQARLAIQVGSIRMAGIRE